MNYNDDDGPQWELVTRTTRTMTHRLSVPGGWLYRVSTIFGSPPGLVADTVFVPVPEPDENG